MKPQALDRTDSSIQDFLKMQESKSILRFITCGSVDDGKSTLIGRLLYDSKLIYQDQLSTLTIDSVKQGFEGDNLDFSLLVDGLEAEREQGITIDVAYRYFATEKRKFIVADTPGHEEYTRNMATGASTAEVAVVLVDAQKGVLKQSRRHSFIASLLGIRDVILAVNKIDLVNYDETVFRKIVSDYQTFISSLDISTVTAIPMSARYGDNVNSHSSRTPWHDGPTLMEKLETIEPARLRSQTSFRLPIQLVSRPDSSFRGFSGQIASGTIRVGDRIVAAQSGQSTEVREILTYDGKLETAMEGQAVTVVLRDEIDVSRGTILVSPDDRPQVADQFQAHVIWFDQRPLLPGRSYILRTETQAINCTISALKYEIDVNTFLREAAKSLKMNEVGVCNFSLQSPIAFDAYRQNRTTGNFVVIDRLTNATVGAGLIDFALRRAENVHWQATEVSKQARAAIKGQTPRVLWFTGLSGSGKSTIANTLESMLHLEHRHTYLLDGDNVRHGLNRDLGFTEGDRVENIRRVAEVAKLMADAGLIVLVSFISPFESERQMCRELMGEGEFLEIFVDTPLEECARRDPKGLYRKAQSGLLQNFTGISSPYEQPRNPELHLTTIGRDPEELAHLILAELRRREN